MERQIKFRVWDGDKMITPNYIENDGSNTAHWNDDDGKDCIGDTIMQHVGKLKNGQDVYEGDIIQHGESIRFIEIRNGNTCATRPSKTESILLSFCEAPKVIGNIYENENLMVVPSA